MRWLWAISIAFLCWTAAVSSTSVPSRHAIVVANLSHTTDGHMQTESLTSVVQQHTTVSELLRKATIPRLSVLPRVHAFPGSPIARTYTAAPAYVIALEIGAAHNLYRQPVIPPQLMRQINWTLGASQQQSRLGGWKESNILYSGMLTYHL